jgi:hypothetical protein
MPLWIVDRIASGIWMRWKLMVKIEVWCLYPQLQVSIGAGASIEAL